MPASSVHAAPVDQYDDMRLNLIFQRMSERPFRQIPRIPCSLHQSLNVERKPCAVATPPECH